MPDTNALRITVEYSPESFEEWKNPIAAAREYESRLRSALSRLFPDADLTIRQGDEDRSSVSGGEPEENTETEIMVDSTVGAVYEDLSIGFDVDD
jgi:hypothetical protein